MDAGQGADAGQGDDPGQGTGARWQEGLEEKGQEVGEEERPEEFGRRPGTEADAEKAAATR